MYKLLYFHGRWLAENIDGEGTNIELQPHSIEHINDALVNGHTIILSSSIEDAAIVLNIDKKDILLVTPCNLIE